MKEAIAKAVSAGNRAELLALDHQNTEVNHPDVGQKEGNNKAYHAFRLSDARFVEAEATRFAIREEGFDVEVATIPLFGLLKGLSVSDQVYCERLKNGHCKWDE